MPPPTSPPFVSITTAPLMAREPYKAVAAAPFKIETDSKLLEFRFRSWFPQSLGLAAHSLPPAEGYARITPSTTKIGILLPLNVEEPRIENLLPPKIPPSPPEISTPAVLPWRAATGFIVFAWATSCPSIVAIEYP